MPRLGQLGCDDESAIHSCTVLIHACGCALGKHPFSDNVTV